MMNKQQLYKVMVSAKMVSSESYFRRCLRNLVEIGYVREMLMGRKTKIIRLTRAGCAEALTAYPGRELNTNSINRCAFTSAHIQYLFDIGYSQSDILKKTTLWANGKYDSIVAIYENIMNQYPYIVSGVGLASAIEAVQNAKSMVAKPREKLRFSFDDPLAKLIQRHHVTIIFDYRGECMHIEVYVYATGFLNQTKVEKIRKDAIDFAKGIFSKYKIDINLLCLSEVQMKQIKLLWADLEDALITSVHIINAFPYMIGGCLH